MVADTLRGRAVPYAAAAAAALLTFRAASGAVGGDPLIALGLVGLVAAAAALLRPRESLLALIVLGATLLPDRSGAFDVAGIRSDPFEAFAFLLIGVWLVHLLVGGAHRPRFLLPWSLFYAGTLVGLWVGARAGASGEVLFGVAKAYAMYLLPLVFSTFFATAVWQNRLERFVFAACTAGSIGTLLAAGAGIDLGGEAVTGVVETLGEATEAQRIRTPLLSLLVVGILLLSARMMTRATRAGDVARMSLYVVAILLSFNRSTWVPLAIGVTLLAVLRRGRRVVGRGFRVGIALSIVGIVTYGAAGAGLAGPTGKAAAERVRSALDSSVTTEESYRDRQQESTVARATLRRSPVVGVGIARPYGARRAVYKDNPPRIVYYDRLFIHNTYFGVWLQLGILGLLGVALLAVAIVREGIAAARTLPPEHSTRNVAAGLAMLVFALAALFQTSLTHRATIVGMSVALALLQRPRQPGRRHSEV